MWHTHTQTYRHTHTDTHRHTHTASSHTVRPPWTLWGDGLPTAWAGLSQLWIVAPHDLQPKMQRSKYPDQSWCPPRWKRWKTFIRPVLAAGRQVAGAGLAFPCLGQPSFSYMQVSIWSTLQGQFLKLFSEPSSLIGSSPWFPNPPNIYCHNYPLTLKTC